MKASELAKGKRGRKPGRCPVCGATATHELMVRVMPRDINGPPRYSGSVSKSMKMCDEHAGDLWLALAAQIEAVRR